jgi:hypothetical protein
VVTPKALKLAIEEAGLQNNLCQEKVNADPLDEETMEKITIFVSLPATHGIQLNPSLQQKGTHKESQITETNL